MLYVFDNCLWSILFYFLCVMSYLFIEQFKQIKHDPLLRLPTIHNIIDTKQIKLRFGLCVIFINILLSRISMNREEHFNTFEVLCLMVFYKYRCLNLNEKGNISMQKFSEEEVILDCIMHTFVTCTWFSRIISE